MTPVDDLLRWMRRFEVADPNVCQRCDGASGHPPIPDDGFPVCVVCVYREGKLAADPLNAPIGIVADTWAAHEDVVDLRRCWKHIECWDWTRTWPDARDLTLMDGNVL
jgi:hypothetical protein